MRVIFTAPEPEQGRVIVDSVKHGLPADTRIAILLPAEIPKHARPVLGGLQEAGWQAAHFTAETEALAWLLAET